MASVHGPKLIAGNSNLKLARSVARRMSLHRGMNVDLVDARVERFNDGEIFVEVYENVRDEDMFIIQPTSRPANDIHELDKKKQFKEKNEGLFTRFIHISF